MCDNYTLVVVDMQPFYTNDAATIANVAREVRAARESNNNIVFLTVPYLSPMQDAPFAPTHQAILNEVKGYDHNHWVEVDKLTQDGSRQVTNACQWKHFDSKCFRLCGVNTDLCVLDTVVGLLESTDATIEVVKDACNTPSDRETAWQKYPTNPRLALLESAEAVSAC